VPWQHPGSSWWFPPSSHHSHPSATLHREGRQRAGSDDRQGRCRWHIWHRSSYSHRQSVELIHIYYHLFYYHKMCNTLEIIYYHLLSSTSIIIYWWCRSRSFSLPKYYRSVGKIPRLWSTKSHMKRLEKICQTIWKDPERQWASFCLRCQDWIDCSSNYATYSSHDQPLMDMNTINAC
jgi:hypothetical protein